MKFLFSLLSVFSASSVLYVCWVWLLLVEISVIATFSRGQLMQFITRPYLMKKRPHNWADESLKNPIGLSNRWGPPLSTKTRLSELLNRYNEEVVPTLKGKVQDSSRIKNSNRSLGNIFLSELTPLLLAEYRDNRLKQLSLTSRAWCLSKWTLRQRSS